MKTLFLSTAFATLICGAAFAAPVKTVDSSIGPVLAGENGMTLYTFQKDTSGVSNCYDKCAVNWPPALVDGDYTIIERSDGTRQWAKGGMPLYFWIKDEKQGDTTGEGVGGVWDVARP